MRKSSREERKSKEKFRKIILVGLILIIFIGGGFFGAKVIYENGVKKGKEEFRISTEEKLKNLSSAVLEKTDFIKLVSENLNEIPEEADEEGFKNYLEKLENLISKTTNENIKNELENYKNNFNEFLDFYKSSEDNNAILEKHNEIKIKTNEVSGKITEIFNEKIKSAAEALNN